MIQNIAGTGITVSGNGTGIDTLRADTTFLITRYDTAAMLSGYEHHYSVLDSLGKLANSSGYLNNDGSGNLSWMAGGGGGLSAIYYDTTHYNNWGIGHSDTVLIPSTRIVYLNSVPMTNLF